MYALVEDQVKRFVRSKFARRAASVLPFTAIAFGKASVFKCFSDEYTASIVMVSGIVALSGGMASFFLPNLFGVPVFNTGDRPSVFMPMYGMVWVSLIWMYWTEVRRTQLSAELAGTLGSES